MIKSSYFNKSSVKHFFEFPFDVCVRSNSKSEPSAYEEFNTFEQAIFYINSIISDNSIDSICLTYRNYGG